MKTYELFSGQELQIAEKIQQRRLQILVHSCIYYELNTNVISDKDWDKYARELVSLQRNYAEIAKFVVWADAFENFDGSTGFNLPLKDPWVMKKAVQLAGTPVTSKKKEIKKKKGRLF